MLAFVATTAAAQATPAETPALRARMDVFAKARQYGDIEALKGLSSPIYLRVIQDSTEVRYARFRAINPSSRLIADDPAFQQFIKGEIPDADDSDFEVLATAFRSIERNEGESEAALVILAHVYRFPRAPIVVGKSTLTFARAESSGAVYYLSEEWVLPLGGGSAEKRFVVEWFRLPSGTWVLNTVR